MDSRTIVSKSKFCVMCTVTCLALMYSTLGTFNTVPDRTVHALDEIGRFCEYTFVW